MALKVLYKSSPIVGWVKYYKQLMSLFSKRKDFVLITPIGEVDDLLNLPLDSKWYRYKNRIFIFRNKYKYASFVITQNTIYSPLNCCNTSFMCFRFGDKRKAIHCYLNDTKTLPNKTIKKVIKLINKKDLFNPTQMISDIIF